MAPDDLSSPPRGMFIIVIRLGANRSRSFAFRGTLNEAAYNGIYQRAVDAFGSDVRHHDLYLGSIHISSYADFEKIVHPKAREIMARPDMSNSSKNSKNVLEFKLVKPTATESDGAADPPEETISQDDNDNKPDTRPSPSPIRAATDIVRSLSSSLGSVDVGRISEDIKNVMKMVDATGSSLDEKFDSYGNKWKALFDTANEFHSQRFEEVRNLLTTELAAATNAISQAGNSTTESVDRIVKDMSKQTNRSVEEATDTVRSLKDTMDTFAADLKEVLGNLNTQAEQHSTQTRSNTNNACVICGNVSTGTWYTCRTCNGLNFCSSCFSNGTPNHAGHFFDRAGLDSTVCQETPERHNASCDICEAAIIGTRFKCTNCPDFDMCQACFAAVSTFHPNHSFAELKKPSQYRKGTTTSGRQSKHSDVSCNGCRKVISGTRYKCVDYSCEDIDLCENCEALPILPPEVPPSHNKDHIMLKVTRPISTRDPRGFTRRISSILEEYTLAESTSNCSARARDARRPASPSSMKGAHYPRFDPYASFFNKNLSAGKDEDGNCSRATHFPPGSTEYRTFIDTHRPPKRKGHHHRPPPFPYELVFGQSSHHGHGHGHGHHAHHRRPMAPPSNFFRSSFWDGSQGVRDTGAPVAPIAVPPMETPAHESNNSTDNVNPSLKNTGLEYSAPAAVQNLPGAWNMAESMNIPPVPLVNLWPHPQSQIFDNNNDISPDVAPSPPEVGHNTPNEEFISSQESLSKDIGDKTPILDSEIIEKLDAEFRKDITITDHLVMMAGTRFDKSWEVANTGNVAWPEGTRIVHVGGFGEAGEAHKVPLLKPGEIGTLTVANLCTPEEYGKVSSYWRLKTPSGEVFGDKLWIVIEIVAIPGEKSTPVSSMVIYPSLSATGRAGSSISGATDDGTQVAVRETTGDYESINGAESPMIDDDDDNWPGSEDAWSVISDDDELTLSSGERSS